MSLTFDLSAPELTAEEITTLKDSESVNHALRMFLELVGQEVKKNLTRGSSGRS